MKIERAEQARRLLAEKETLERAIECTLTSFNITVKVDAQQPKKMLLEAYLRTFTADELREMMKVRLQQLEKELRRL